MRIKCELRITDKYGSDLRSYDHYLSSSENKATLLIADTQPVLIRSY